MSELIKFHYSPIWKVEETEQWLREMEESGWRLVKVSRFGWKYHFKQSKPKSVQYFFGTYITKGYDILWSTNMWEIMHKLQTDFLSNEIPYPWSYHLWLHRITMDSDLSRLKDARLICLRNQAIKDFGYSTVPFLSTLVFWPLIYLLSPLLFWIAFPICLILSGLWIGYHLFGVVKMTRRVRVFKKRNRRK